MPADTTSRARRALLLAALAAAGARAWGDDAARPGPAGVVAAPPGPSFRDLLARSGVEVKGYVDVAAEGSDLKSGGNPYKVNDTDHATLTLHGIGLTVDHLPK